MKTPEQWDKEGVCHASVARKIQKDALQSVPAMSDEPKWIVRRGEGMKRVEGIWCGTRLIQSAKRGVNLHKIADAHNESIDAAVRAAVKERGEDDSTIRIERTRNGKAFVVYLKDGRKITVGRTKDTYGEAWLEIQPTPTVRATIQQQSGAKP